MKSNTVDKLVDIIFDLEKLGLSRDSIKKIIHSVDVVKEKDKGEK